MFKITKSIEFDFGHRVYSQQVVSNLACTSTNACRRLHGHRGKINITLKGDVNSSGMVFDFKNLSFIKEWINENLDHRFLIHCNDPLLRKGIINFKDASYQITTSDHLILSADPLHRTSKYSISQSTLMKKEITTYPKLFSYYWMKKQSKNQNKMFYTLTISSSHGSSCEDYIREWNESFVICNFIPTAENLCAAFYYWIKSCLQIMKKNDVISKSIVVDEIEFYETPTSFAVYREG